MDIKQINVDKLIPYINNPRKNDDAVDQVASSIKNFGFKVPIVIDKDNEIITGHTRLKAAKKLGIEEVPCIIADDLTPAQIKAFRIADNKVAEIAEWDMDLLGLELSELEELEFDISDMGFEDEELDDILGRDTEVVEDDFEEEPPDEPESKLGDIWTLGRHRLMCGDSTSEVDVNVLMNGEKADISFTSPPYNVGNVIIDTGENSRYANDGDDKQDVDYLNLLKDFTNLALKYSKYTFVNIQSLANNKRTIVDYLYTFKNKLAETMIWDKGSTQPAMAEYVLNSSFEFIYVFSDKANRAIGTKYFRGTLDNIVRVKKQSSNEFAKLHNATFPIDLPSHFIQNFSTKSVLDVFGGTGTTLIACEQLDRICYMMELDPKYIDVIIERYIEFTGNKVYRLNEDGTKTDWNNIKT